MNFIIPISSICWYCDICGTEIEPILPINEQVIIPASKYWHSIKKVPYCSPLCSLIGHNKQGLDLQT